MNARNRDSGAAGDALDPVARAIRIAGPRKSPGASVEQSVRGAVEREWHEVARQYRRRRARRAWLAASLVAFAVSTSWVVVHHLPPERIGWVVGARGQVKLTPMTGHHSIAVGDALSSGTRIETGPGGAALLTFGSVGVRLGSGSVLELERASAVRLVSGRLYVDSERIDPGRRFVVATEFGTVTHRGTQYQVQVEPGRSLFASVREGTIEVEAYGRAQFLARSEGLRVMGSRAISRETVSPYGESWKWVSDYAPEVAIDGRSLSVFLDWFARETGRTLVFVLPASREDTDRTMLSGSVSGLTPEQALEAVMATTRFRCDLTMPGQIRISERATTTARIDRHVFAVAASKARLSWGKFWVARAARVIGARPCATDRG
jgi:ferric-dicitrate binding protein FerR (iron transport regulator)